MPTPHTPETLQHPQGRVLVRELGSGRRHVTVEPFSQSLYVSSMSCETKYPIDLIARVLDAKGLGFLCEEIGRDEDPQFVELTLRWATLSYVGQEEFRGKRLLDFGSGAGASTLILARLFPHTDIVGIELLPQLVELARLRADFHRATNVKFLLSPGPEELPAGLGSFDFIMFSAVYEHLLPPERRELFPYVWSLLKPGGILFLNQTPYRWYPHEYHTTGLPLLNYLPDDLAWRVARRLSLRVRRNASWEELLRDGIRGATEAEVLQVLASAGHEPPIVLRPSRLGCEDTIDIWYGYSTARRPLRVKRTMRAAFKAISRLTGTVMTPELDLALRRR
jgi:SAM-dependent methyltransferase